jgi:hypothetical protein
MLFFGRSFTFLVVVVFVLLFVSSIFEYQSGSARGRPQIWKAKDATSTGPGAELDIENEYDEGGIIGQELPSDNQGKPPAPFSRLMPSKLSKESKSNVGFDEYMRDMLKWERPREKEGHWPSYRDFVNRDYDPNRWEGFQL